MGVEGCGHGCGGRRGMQMWSLNTIRVRERGCEVIALTDHHARATHPSMPQLPHEDCDLVQGVDR